MNFFSMSPENRNNARPKSANRKRDETSSGNQSHLRPSRPDRERLMPTPKRPSTIPRRMMNDNVKLPTKAARGIITVPITQKQQAKVTHPSKLGLPNQDVIKKYEDLELQPGESSDMSPTFSDLNEKDSVSSRGDTLIKLKINWQDKMVMFDKMKNELDERQKAIIKVYAAMRTTHQKLCTLGHKTSLPPVEDLRIMNIAKLSPEQLLEICTGTKTNDTPMSKSLLTINVNKLLNLPSNLVNTCEQTLEKRKEIIDWFESLMTADNGQEKNKKAISVMKLTMKIQEFNAENKMLHCNLDKDKAEFLEELKTIVEYIREGVKETMALQLRIEELTYELSELNSQNADLRKRINNADHLKPQSNKNRIEELEKELKEEKCKRNTLKDRLNRADGQVKINAERALQLESSLEQARAQSWNLERTVQHLHEQNKNLQNNFETELNKLTESIKEHTVHLEEIADAREKLQAEKEDLEKKLNELSLHYNESIKTLKEEMNVKLVKLIETEEKYNEEVEDKKKLEGKLESLCAQLVESELRFKDINKNLKEKETQLIKLKNNQKDLEATKHELSIANKEIEDYKNRLTAQSEAIKEIEKNFKETLSIQKDLKCELNDKDEYITELEKKQTLLEQQLQESEDKMSSYENQLLSLKNHISQLQQDFGDFENLNELRGMINQQRVNLLEATRQNGELAEALQKKEIELDNFMENLEQQRQMVEQKNDVINMLSKKEEEQANIIKLLRNNLEMRTQAEADLNQQVTEKNAEIDSLISNVETRKRQICQLEKIILTLNEQTRKVSILHNKDIEKINDLEKKITEYDSYHMGNKNMNEAPDDNLDNLIKILEDELGAPLESLNTNDEEYQLLKKRFAGQRATHDKPEKLEFNRGNNNYHYQSDHETVPTKIVMGNFVKKTYISSKEDQITGDNLDRKKAITNIDTQKWMPSTDPGINIYENSPVLNPYPQFRGLIPAANTNETYLTKNLQFLIPNRFRDEKKSKMFKLAGHRL